MASLPKGLPAIPANFTRRGRPEPTELNSKHHQAIALLIFGDEANAFEPYSIEQVAERIGYQRRGIRTLMTAKVFRQEYAKQLDAYRDGEHAKSLRTLTAIRDDVGENTAADRTARIKAIATLHPAPTEGRGLNVNIANTIVTKGLIVDLRDDTEAEIAERAAMAAGKPRLPITIEHAPAEERRP